MIEKTQNGKNALLKKRAVIVGYGNRGQVYAGYALSNPNELEIAAVVDVNEFRLKEAKRNTGSATTCFLLLSATF